MRILIILFIACAIFHCNEADLNFGSGDSSDGQGNTGSQGGPFKKEFSGNAPNGPYDVIYGQNADGKKFYHQEGPGMEFVIREGDYVEAGLGPEKDYFKIVNGRLILITPPDTTGTSTTVSARADAIGSTGTRTTGPAETETKGSAGTGITGSPGTGITGSAGIGTTVPVVTGSTGSAVTGTTEFAGTGATGSAGTGSTGLDGAGTTRAAGTGTTGSAGTGARGSSAAGVIGSSGTGVTRSAGTGTTRTVVTDSTQSESTATGLSFVFDLDLMKDARIAHILESFPQISDISFEVDIDVQRVDLSKIFTQAFTARDGKSKGGTTPANAGGPSK